MNFSFKSVWATTALLIAAVAAQAQGIQRKAEPYQVQPVLPIAAPVTAPPISITAAAPAQAGFAVSPADRSIREALSRWARAAGWVHEHAHWAVDKDFPVASGAGPEIFGPDFKGAVRVLLSSTELTDRPVQPCFYTNNVVRVIPRAELCDRTVQ